MFNYVMWPPTYISQCQCNLPPQVLMPLVSLASLGSTSRLQQTLPPSVSITPVFKRKSADVSNGDAKKQKDSPGPAGITIFKETSITPKECAPPWSLGCVYRCAICGVKFQVT